MAPTQLKSVDGKTCLGLKWELMYLSFYQPVYIYLSIYLSTYLSIYIVLFGREDIWAGELGSLQDLNICGLPKFKRSGQDSCWRNG